MQLYQGVAVFGLACLLLFEASRIASGITIHVRQEACGNGTTLCCGAADDLDCPSLDSAMEQAQLLATNSVGIEISLPRHQQPYKLVNVTTLDGMRNFSIQGYEGEVEIRCDVGAGLAFLNSNGITLRHIRFVGCGAVRASTSRDLSVPGQTSFLKFRVALYFLFCASVVMQDVVVTESTGTGLVLYSTVGRNMITDSIFSNNEATQEELNRGGGGGVTIEFIFCIPGNVSCFDKDTSSSPGFFSNSASYIIHNCSFSQNKATTTNYNATAFTSSFHSYHVALGRGGGLSTFFKGTANSNTILLTNCSFEKNEAVWGGGLLVEFDDSSSNNSVEVMYTVFEENSCQYHPFSYNGTGGGGARIAFVGFSNEVKGNNITMVGTSFNNNQAYFGGGVSVQSISDDNNISLSTNDNIMEFIDCSWTGNVARLGSALDMASYQERAIVRPVLTSCIFESNSVRYSKYSGIAAGIGTIYVDSIPLVIKDTFNSRNNQGSGIVSLNAELEFTENCVANFTNNTGQNGGALALFSAAFLRVSNSTSMIFTKNHAYLYGGAIFWESQGNHGLISSSTCFIRYEARTLSPYKWPVKFLFDGNSAGLFGNAIYATTLITCLWGGVPFGVLRDPSEAYDQVFCWNNGADELIWDYADDYCNTSIATAPGYFTGTSTGKPYMSSIFPGQPLKLPVNLVDDRRQSIPTKGLVYTWMENERQHGYVSRELSVTRDQPEGSVTLTVNTIQPRVLTAEVIVNFTECPTGFIFNYNTSTCIAGGYLFLSTRADFTASIQQGYWIGYNRNRTALIVSLCFHCGDNPRDSSSITLPKNPAELNDFFCGPLNRTGMTCSQCRNGTGPAINSKFYPCVECPPNVESYSWIFLILSKFVPYTIFLIVVIAFNVSVTSGPANAFIFFAQIISTTFAVDANGVIPFQTITPAANGLREAYTAIYDIWNLNFFDAVRGWQFCLSPKLTTLHLATIDYITAFYPLFGLLMVFIVAVLYDRQNRVIVWLIKPLHRLLARFRRRWSFRRSITDAFATVIVLSFSKIAVSTQNILSQNTVYGANGTEVTRLAYLFGEYDITSQEYLPHFIVALIVFIFTCVAIPGILLLYSIKPFYSCINKLKLTFLLPGEKFQHFLNAFHYCYKDGANGTHDLRFFAALYFILRVVLIWTYGLTPDWITQYVMQQIICTLAVLLFGVLQPYKKPFYNFLDSAFFALLATINILTVFNRYREAANLPLNAAAYWIEIILIFSPLLYITGFLIYYFYNTRKPAIKKVLQKLCYRMEEAEDGQLKSVARFQGLTRLRAVTNTDDGFDDFMIRMVEEGQWRSTTNYYGPPEEFNEDTELPETVSLRRVTRVGHSTFSLSEDSQDIIDGEGRQPRDAEK